MYEFGNDEVEDLILAARVLDSAIATRDHTDDAFTLLACKYREVCAHIGIIESCRDAPPWVRRSPTASFFGEAE